MPLRTCVSTRPPRARYNSGVWSARQRSQFYRSLGQLLSAGVAAVQALQTLRVRAAADIERGATLHEALARWGQLPASEVQLLELGERSGRLDVVLGELAEYAQTLHRMQRRLISGLILPASVLAVAAFVVPLPAWFATGDSAAYWMSSVGFLALVAGSIALIGFVVVRLPAAARDRLLRAVPVVGGAWRQFQLWRVARGLEMLLGAGLGILPALRAVAEVCPSPPLASALRAAADAAEKRGASVSASLENSRQVPAEWTALWAVGEQSGRLDEMLQRLACAAAYRLEERLQWVGRVVPWVVYALVSLYLIVQIFALAGRYVQLLESGF